MGEVAPSTVLRKVTWRLIPFLLVLYVVNIIDRINVGFARLQMLDALEMSEKAFAFGAGLFYIGYFVFEVPSNLILSRTGARLWIARIMISWGMISSAMMFVTGPWSFYALRLLLGFAEAGFFPGIILYLTYWFPARQRARAVSRFMAAGPLASIIGGPLSGAILQYLDRTGGLAGWQWLFLLEGIPSMLLGVAVLVYLTDRPQQARWLTPGERDWLAGEMEREESDRQQRHGLTFSAAMTDGKVWLLILLYVTVATTINSLGFYLPELVRTLFPKLDKFEIGVATACSSLCAVIGMVLVGTHSDHTGERRWHVAGSAFVAGLGWTLGMMLPTPELRFCGLVMAHIGMSSMLAPFWTLPTGYLSGTAAAGGIALINSFGNLGGFFGPVVLGFTKTEDGSFAVGMMFMAALLVLGGVLALCVRKDTAKV